MKFISKLLTVLQSNMYQELQGKSEDNPQICLKLFEKNVVVIPTKLIQITRTCFHGGIQYQYNTLEYAIPVVCDILIHSDKSITLYKKGEREMIKKTSISCSTSEENLSKEVKKLS